MAEARWLFPQQFLQRVFAIGPVGIALLCFILHFLQEVRRRLVKEFKRVQVAQVERRALQQRGVGCVDAQGAAGQPDLRQGGAEEIVGDGIAVIGRRQPLARGDVVHRGARLVEAANKAGALQGQHRGSHLLLVVETETGGGGQAPCAHQGRNIAGLGVDFRCRQGAAVGAQQYHAQHISGFDRRDLLYA